MGCKPLIGLDGCHLKGVHKGQLLSAVGIDGNNGMYPISWAVVEIEARGTWTWFLDLLKVDLSLDISSRYVFISDKQKGLELAIKELFPDSEHRHCVRHLYNNFKGDGHTGLELKQLMWDCARSTTMIWVNRNMETISKRSIFAWKWLNDGSAKHWSRSHFNIQAKCDILLNNLCESYNASILESRKKPILTSLEEMRVSTMVRLANRRNSGSKWRSKVGPRIEKLIKKNADRSHEYTPLESAHMRFEVHGKGVACASGVVSQHYVQLDKKSCSCQRWDLSGIPCAHAIAAIYSKGLSPDDFVDECFTKKRYMMAYEPVINPIPGVDEWEQINRPIGPPKFRKLPGRPKMSRNKEPGEDPPPAGTTKLLKSYYSQITCTLCKVKGHNHRTRARRSKTSTSQPRAHVPNDNLAENVMNEQESMENSLQQLSPQNGDVQVSNDSLILDVHFNVLTQQGTAQMKRGKLTTRKMHPIKPMKPQNGPNEGAVRPIWKP